MQMASWRAVRSTFLLLDITALSLMTCPSASLQVSVRLWECSEDLHIGMQPNMRQVKKLTYSMSDMWSIQLWIKIWKCILIFFILDVWISECVCHDGSEWQRTHAWRRNQSHSQVYHAPVTEWCYEGLVESHAERLNNWARGEMRDEIR